MSDSFDNPGQVCLRGSLILADPALRDPNFNRSVLLLTEHRADAGAHGYVLNRPLGKSLGELLPGPEFKALAGVPVLIGGPVGQEKLTFASFLWDDEDRRLSWTTHLSVDDAKVRHREGEIIRAFVGYSGWAEGQLENELRQHAWITRRPEAQVLDDGFGSMWSRLLATMGPRYRMISRMPDDPSLN